MRRLIDVSGSYLLDEKVFAIRSWRNAVIEENELSEIEYLTKTQA